MIGLYLGSNDDEPGSVSSEDTAAILAPDEGDDDTIGLADLISALVAINIITLEELSLDDPRDFLRDLALRYANEEAELNEDPDNRG